MKNEDKKLYERAMKLYGDGNIDKALQICEKAISYNMKNSAAINLKGLLLYMKGELKAATDTWKVNRDFNDNSISKGYLRDSKQDENRLIAYKQALELIKELKIREALDKLYFCTESDFNLINVYNALAYCYIKTGDFVKAEQCINKVLSVSKDNKAAMDNKKLLSEFNVEKSSGKVKKIIAILVAGLLLVTVIWRSYEPIMKYINETVKINNKEEAVSQKNIKERSENKIKQEDDKSKKNVSKSEQGPINSNIFDAKKLLSFIDSKDYNQINNTIENINKDSLDINHRNAYDRAYSLMQNDGVESFYKQGTTYYKVKDFEKANSEFLKAYKYSSQTYLRQHVQYMLANSFEKLNDIENGCKYYEEYVNENRENTQKDYMEESLYKLAILLKSTEKEKSIKYAKELVKQYPNSIYNNSTIKEILK